MFDNSALHIGGVTLSVENLDSAEMSDERDSRGQERDGGAVRDRSRSRDRSSGGGGGGGGGGAVGGEDAKLFVGNLSFEARYVT